MEIKIPNFTLGWEFESITDAFGNSESTEDYYCDNCGDVYNEECDDHNGCESDGPDYSCPIKEIETHEDGSVNGAGMEYVLKKEYVTFPKAGIHALWMLLKHTEVDTDKSCGFHVHIGLPERTTKSLIWAGWVQQLGIMLEEDVFLAVPESRRKNSYCRKLKGFYGALSEKRYSPDKYSNSDRYFWVNTVEMFRPSGIRTVEFRLMGNVSRFSYLLFWIAFCRRMSISAWKLSHDVSMLSKELIELRNWISEMKTIFLPRINPSKEINRLQLAYEWSSRTGLNLREKSRPLTTLINIEADIKWSKRYSYVLHEDSHHTSPFKVGDNVICKEEVARYNVTRPGVRCVITAVSSSGFIYVNVPGHTYFPESYCVEGSKFRLMRPEEISMEVSR